MSSILRFDEWQDSNGNPVLDVSSGLDIPKAALPSGSVLQVLQVIKTDTSSTSSTSFQDVSSLSVSITPISTSSKILVLVTGVLGASGTNNDVAEAEVLRDSTQIGGGGISRMSEGQVPERSRQVASAVILDTPNTTSALTYKVRFRSPAGITAYWGRSGTNSVAQISSITVMEIAG